MQINNPKPKKKNQKATAPRGAPRPNAVSRTAREVVELNVCAEEAGEEK